MIIWEGVKPSTVTVTIKIPLTFCYSRNKNIRKKVEKMKKIIGLLMCMCIIVSSFVGCSKAPGLEYNPEEEFSYVEETVVMESESIPEEASEAPEEDPWWMYKTTEATARENSQLCVLKGDGNFYTVESVLNDPTEEQLSVKRFELVSISNKYYVEQRDLMHLNWDFRNQTVISLIDADAITLESGDKLIKYDLGTPPSLKLYPAEQNGYTVAISGYDRQYVSDPILSDKDGNEVEDWYNLEYGAEYTVSWYEGTQYYEVVYPAISRVYQYSEDKSEAVELEPIYTKEGYVEYDTSNLEPGLYYDVYGGIINIQ